MPITAYTWLFIRSDCLIEVNQGNNLRTIRWLYDVFEHTNVIITGSLQLHMNFSCLTCALTRLSRAVLALLNPSTRHRRRGWSGKLLWPARELHSTGKRAKTHQGVRLMQSCIFRVFLNMCVQTYKQRELYIWHVGAFSLAGELNLLCLIHSVSLLCWEASGCKMISYSVVVQGGTVEQREVLQSHSSRVPALIPSSSYYTVCGEFCVFFLCRVSPPKNMHDGGLITLNCS